ncbi:hypothetical protein K431DRAFT_286068 [Polychaeton citri CBS 116435]|uniref:Uncharacterized protein n=1 Tax=Polychaeton citri CBS 116435 TaxID=1314669 RepID=A0A9P4Q5R0_9PEZI|nr:hypothetical protein K431DRAFT_286068 [Polychaeton citri CBS 116435]
MYSPLCREVCQPSGRRLFFLRPPHPHPHSHPYHTSATITPKPSRGPAGAAAGMRTAKAPAS